MVILSGLLFGLLALLWTGGAFAFAELVQWGAQALASGGAVDTARGLATLPVPQWIALWVDPALVQAAQSVVLWTLDAAREAVPMLGSAAGWLVALVWVLWAVGLVALLVAAGGSHLVLRRLRGRVRPH
ncbi:hypothetical protein JI739_22355 [Ramlibacter sp. AW1]|uniref:Uncharacterized protein n=1 Tax=Ramlibacter aurantiacus TaxID=2801330 RepID=A0A937D3V2_9BURK|nr:hypothetical protein [Ramlibacter aurantiacus]MBL0423094.1 hypothetical protein [Ramlibacter aurantiacus]